MTPSSLLLTARDDELLGTAHRSDGMGVLPVWSERARDLVPHLTEQTTEVLGFQILVEAFRLWETWSGAHPQDAERADDFFVLVEQAYARVAGYHQAPGWNLPGRRRVEARRHQPPHISLSDPGWHLLDAQRANGVWGLYRGAASRAGLLDETLTRLSSETLAAASAHPVFAWRADWQIRDLIGRAMAGETVPMPTHLRGHIPQGICAATSDPPLRGHLHERLVEAHPLNRALAERLLLLDPLEPLDHRAFLVNAAADLADQRAALVGALRCEDLLAPLEAMLFWLCAHKGSSLELAANGLPIDLRDLERARSAFADSGRYLGPSAAARHQLFHTALRTDGRLALLRSVLDIHERVSKARGRAAWVWEDGGRLLCDVDLPLPSEAELSVGVAWRNDYYLRPLRLIAAQLRGPA